MPWWIWIVLGLVFHALEMLTPSGFFVFFFGLSALAIGGLVGVGIGGPAWFQWLLFSLLSVSSVVLFRRPLLTWITARKGHTVGVETLIGETATLLDDLGRLGP